jgi:general secretion pathway protein J
MTPRPARAEGGFTLIELLVAVTLLGLLMAALLGGVRLGVRAWEAGDTRLDADVRLTAVQDFLRDRLTQARLAEPATADPDSGPAWRGQPDRLSFVTLMPEHLGAGLERMTLALTPAEDGTDLTVEWWPAELGQEPKAARDAVQSRVLLARVAELRLAYFGAVDPRQPPTWSEVWEQASLPRLVRVQLRFADRDARSWPDLIVRPMIEGESY